MKRRILCFVSAFLLLGVLAIPAFASNTPLDDGPWVTIHEADLSTGGETEKQMLNSAGNGLYMVRAIITLNDDSQWNQSVIMAELAVFWQGTLFSDIQNFTFRLADATNNGEPIEIYQLVNLRTTSSVKYYFQLSSNSFVGTNDSCHVVIQRMRYDTWQGGVGSYQEGYEDGYNEGYSVGHTEGFSEGENVGYNNGYADGYDVGLGDGSDNSAVVGEAIEGYFAGVIAFLDIFMGLGIGVLTVGNLIGLSVVTLIVILIIRIIRG